MKEISGVKRGLFFLLFMLAGCLMQAGNVTKIQEELNLSHYGQAKVLLDKAFLKSDHDYRLYFLLTKYFFAVDNTAYQPDSAYVSIGNCIQYLPDSSDKIYLKNLKYGFSKINIYAMKKDIIEEAYFMAERKNDLAAYDHFIDNYDDDYFRRLAIQHRDDLAFDKAKETKDFMSLKEFMVKYPDASQAKEARQLYEKLLYENVEKDGRWQAYKQYLDKYPDAAFRADAKAKYERLLFEYYRQQKDINTLFEFIQQNPMNSYREQAESLLFHGLCKDFNTATLYAFIQRYPSLHIVNHLWKMIYINETYLDNDTVYRSFLEGFPSFPLKALIQRDLQISSFPYKVFEDNGKYGFKSMLTDSIIQPAIYYDIQEFSGRLCAVSTLPPSRDKYKYGFINKKFELAIPCVYDEVYDFDEGLSIVGTGKCPEGNCKYGIINEIGDTILPLNYTNINEFHDRLALVEQEDGKIGYINNAGIFVIKPQFKKARNFSEGLAAVITDSLWYFIDSAGKPAFQLRAYAITDVKNDMISYSFDGNSWGVMNKKGVVIKEPLFKEPVIFESDSTRVRCEEKEEKKGRIQYVLNEYILFKDGRMEKIK